MLRAYQHRKVYLLHLLQVSRLECSEAMECLVTPKLRSAEGPHMYAFGSDVAIERSW